MPPPSMILKARSGEVAILDSPDHTTVRAWVLVRSSQMLMLEIARPVDPVILGHMQRTEEAVANTTGWTATVRGCRSPSF